MEPAKFEESLFELSDGSTMGNTPTPAALALCVGGSTNTPVVNDEGFVDTQAAGVIEVSSEGESEPSSSPIRSSICRVRKVKKTSLREVVPVRLRDRHPRLAR